MKADVSWGGENDVHNVLHHEDDGSVGANDVRRDLSVHEDQELEGVDQVLHNTQLEDQFVHLRLEQRRKPSVGIVPDGHVPRCLS